MKRLCTFLITSPACIRSFAMVVTAGDEILIASESMHVVGNLLYTRRLGPMGLNLYKSDKKFSVVYGRSTAH